MKFHFLLSFAAIALFLSSSCQSEDSSFSNRENSDSKVHFQSDSLTIAEAWARPGSLNGNSAAYLKIYNGSQATDTLLSVTSSMADQATLHETFEKEGLTGMRPAGLQIIPPDSVLKLQPGGLHIMLMNLRQRLVQGDSVKIVIEFSRAGKRNILVPSKALN